jgi:hypothetical protein
LADMGVFRNGGCFAKRDSVLFILASSDNGERKGTFVVFTFVSSSGRTSSVLGLTEEKGGGKRKRVYYSTRKRVRI